MLSRPLHAQVFENIAFPPPSHQATNIALAHLRQHALSPSQASSLPDISFDLPPLQGSNLVEHFHTIGQRSAEPYLRLAKTYASIDISVPFPKEWVLDKSGWTKYHRDGSFHSVSYPVKDTGEVENMLTLDVETMPTYHPYPILACALGEDGWYTWLSPWLLGETEDAEHLIPLGNDKEERIVVGHHVSYDRARIRDEYTIHGTKTRFLDTMAMHVAVKGISSHQRPAWIKYRKGKQKEKEAREAQIAQELLQDTADKPSSYKTPDPLQLSPEDDPDSASQRWEEITSANSLADIYSLYFPTSPPLSKAPRSLLLTSTRTQILESLSTYLTYCATDVLSTYRVFTLALPAFLSACPHPVSFAGILEMGSGVLCVDEAWEGYIEKAEGVYWGLEKAVRGRLRELAREVKESETRDAWLDQLDWTPKVAGKSRGVVPQEKEEEVPQDNLPPAWYTTFTANPFSKLSLERIVPTLLQITWDGHPFVWTPDLHWHYETDSRPPVNKSGKPSKKKISSVFRKTLLKLWRESESFGCLDADLAMNLAKGNRAPSVESRLRDIASSVVQHGPSPNTSHLDWTPSKRKRKLKRTPAEKTYWPKWYWDLTRPKKGQELGMLDITVRARVAPILLRLSWFGHPLVHSREHGWCFRVSIDQRDRKKSKKKNPDLDITRLAPLTFYDPADAHLSSQILKHGFRFFKLPHKDGESANVGNPFGKTFVKYAEDGVLRSELVGDEGAKMALEMNAMCSYWISARDRIMNQMVVWEDKERGKDLGFPVEGKGRYGIVLPQVITMGTVTRRAIEKTWLTASNAKKNRVGSELKAMVRAPPGYAIVGADVDSEELWISSAMGDAQFGFHGATAIGWMTLEGTKAQGTDLHSKTASILGISRDQAKVFNYSRIYGAGMKHAMLLLAQDNPAMKPDEARRLAEALYASTKGKNTHRADIFGRKFWFGGTESFLFNKLEQIAALAEHPRTPALDCSITKALSKEHLPAEFGSDYMTSRINWVVQSSGVDYLHLLIVAMDHLIKTYRIQARYLISVHDELRYLVKWHDRYRLALALQIANLWTRALFAIRLGMDDLPQGVAFFSSVDVDRVLRKEVDMTCVTPSQPDPIPPGESLDIRQILSKTKGLGLGDPVLMEEEQGRGEGTGFVMPDCTVHRASSPAFLRAQATSDFGEVKMLAHQATGQNYEGDIGGTKRGKRVSKKAVKKKVSLGNGEGYDWTEVAEKLLKQDSHR